MTAFISDGSEPVYAGCSRWEPCDVQGGACFVCRVAGCWFVGEWSYLAYFVFDDFDFYVDVDLVVAYCGYY